MNLAQEKEALDRLSENSLYAAGSGAAMMNYSFEVLSRFLIGNSILELGPAEGIMTDRLVTLGKRLTTVEGAERFCKDLRRRHPQITVVNALFEEFATDDSFDNIVMGHVLESVEDPVALLAQAKPRLAPGGRILAAAPNARSLHRQAGVIMGLLPVEDAMNEMDPHQGHRRVFNPESFRACFTQAGYRIDIFGGYWLKPVSSAQIENSWTPEMLRAFFQLGERYPDIAGDIYIVGSLPQEGSS
jgi:2-polyprenyl-3-methyl-5-hydroxy-6-metoxy-1,4-benzoquinol methylase